MSKAVAKALGAREAEKRKPEAVKKQRRSALPLLSLSLHFADASARGVVSRHRVQRCLRAALDAPAELAVRFVGEVEGRALNAQYRGRDYATNVLTFPYATEPMVQADLVLCAPVLLQEAQDLGIALADHYAHLLVHGALHAQGFDHETDDEAAVMQARETAILAGLGVADPYALG